MCSTRHVFSRSRMNSAAEQPRVRLHGRPRAKAASSVEGLLFFEFFARVLAGVVRPLLAVIVSRCWGWLEMWGRTDLRQVKDSWAKPPSGGGPLPCSPGIDPRADSAAKFQWRP